MLLHDLFIISAGMRPPLRKGVDPAEVDPSAGWDLSVSFIIRRNGETLGRFGFSARRRDLHSASRHLGTSELSAGLCKAAAIQYKNTERLRAIFSGPF